MPENENTGALAGNDRVEEQSVLWCEALYGNKTRKGLVRITYGLGFDLTIAPEEARDFALNLLSAAESADQDHFIMEWLEKRVGIPDLDKRAAALSDFRSVREQMRKGESILEFPKA